MCFTVFQFFLLFRDALEFGTRRKQHIPIKYCTRFFLLHQKLKKKFFSLPRVAVLRHYNINSFNSVCISRVKIAFGVLYNKFKIINERSLIVTQIFFHFRFVSFLFFSHFLIFFFRQNQILIKILARKERVAAQQKNSDEMISII